MSLCDKCYAPGACCKSFALSSGGHEITTWVDEGREAAIARVTELNLPFLPIGDGYMMYDDDGREYQNWRWSCPKLSDDGRCTIYENRPALCAAFEAGSDQLCVHWRGAEGDEQNIIPLSELT